MFEHKVVSKLDISDAEAYLDSLSEDGWELVGVDDYKLYLKRPKEEKQVSSIRGRGSIRINPRNG